MGWMEMWRIRPMDQRVANAGIGGPAKAGGAPLRVPARGRLAGGASEGWTVRVSSEDADKGIL